MRVFAQTAALRLDLAELQRATRSYFDATLEVLGREQPELRADQRDHVELFLDCERYRYSGAFSIRTRQTVESDWADARLAEQNGRAAGMATLAARCPTIWEVDPIGEDSEPARLNLCAILAAVALGPVLPDDHGTLFGVRGAMERVERWLRAK